MCGLYQCPVMYHPHLHPTQSTIYNTRTPAVCTEMTDMFLPPLPLVDILSSWFYFIYPGVWDYENRRRCLAAFIFMNIMVPSPYADIIFPSFFQCHPTCYECPPFHSSLFLPFYLPFHLFFTCHLSYCFVAALVVVLLILSKINTFLYPTPL